MTWFVRKLLLVLSSLAFGLLLISLVQAHEWYPHECCSGMDCAPVEAMYPLSLQDAATSSKLPALVAKTKHGTTIVPPDAERRESKDHRTHVCMRVFSTEPFKPFLCIFIPPGM